MAVRANGRIIHEGNSGVEGEGVGLSVGDGFSVPKIRNLSANFRGFSQKIERFLIGFSEGFSQGIFKAFSWTGRLNSKTGKALEKLGIGKGRGAILAIR